MGKRKTHDEYVAELAVKNPGVTVVGEYVNNATKIEHICGCGANWNITPSGALRGHGCERCRKKKIRANCRKSHREYVSALKLNNPGVKVVENYSGQLAKIKHICRCGQSWHTTPRIVMQGGGCKKCGTKKQADRVRKDSEYQEWLVKNRPQIKLIGRYKNRNTKALHKCCCGNDWSATPRRVMQGQSCMSCHHDSLSGAESYKRYLTDNRTDVALVGKYTTANKPCSHQCKKCGHRWKAIPNNVKTKQTGCPHCHPGSDANVIYLWQNDEGVYKVGITSERCAEERIKQCASKNNMTPRVILMLKTPNARDIERRALELGDDPRYPDTIDGYTEFRRYSDAELGEVWRMAVGA